MKLNTTPRHYMPLSQSQSDEDECGPCKEEKGKKLSFKNSFVASSELSKDSGHVEIYEVDSKNLPMTPIRKFLFIVSLILCVLFVVVFVFLVPCSKVRNFQGTCHLTKLWNSVHQNISLISPLSFVHSEIFGSCLIILGYTNQDSGLIAVDGSSGKERWRLSLHSSPTFSLCDAIDVNSDGYPECIVAGNNGLLTAVDLRKGISLWYLHNHSNLPTVISLERPILVPDCDSDDIADLFIPYLSNGDDTIYLALVSGGTGQIIGSLLELPQCIGPVKGHFTWKMQNETDFILYCNGEETGNLWLLSSRSVCEVALNESNRLVLDNVFRVPKFAQNASFYQLSTWDNHLILDMNGNEIMLLEKATFSFHMVWKTTLENHKNLRILTDGQFSGGSNQLVVLSSYLFHTKVTGLDLKDGKEVWSITQEKGNITSAMRLPKFFANSDGIVLKIVSSLPSTSLFISQNEEKKLIESNSSSSKDNKRDGKELGVFTQLKENYVLVKPEKVPVVTNLYTEEIWSFCKENVCKPDVFTPDTTALVNASHLGISVDMLAVSSTLHPTNNSVPIREVYLKYWNLENVCYISRCTL